ncbi:MAG: membrane dipeptidase [Candidatus Heimdallarchaeota archaeon]|nr:MAG: membrane dipeptidase [Candidatus Heimdallarchaeota archaeon]
MGRNKNYHGYKAFQYLSPRIDYKSFKLRKAIKEEWTYLVPVSKSEEERVEEILEKHFVIDLHEHPVIMPEDSRQSIEMWREGREFMAYEALSYSGLDAVFDNLMNGSALITSKHGWKWSDTIHDLGHRLCDIANQDFVIHCTNVEDIITAHKTGKLAWVAVLESSSCIENEVDRIDILYGLGIRSMGLNYSESNMLGSGLQELRDGGLTDFGYDCITRMNKVRMLIDVSHVSDQTALDAIESSKTPIVVSHAGARALLPIKRLFPDEVLQALAEKKGVIGIEAAPGYTATKTQPIPSIETYMEHLEYCMELMGIDYVGCGPDTLYGDHVGYYHLVEERHRTAGLGHYTRPGQKRDLNVNSLPDYVKGMENPTECMPNITRWLVKHGYSDQEIAKIIGGNALRVLKKVW